MHPVSFTTLQSSKPRAVQFEADACVAFESFDAPAHPHPANKGVQPINPFEEPRYTHRQMRGDLFDL